MLAAALQHWTNAEIAEPPFISVHTVESPGVLPAAQAPIIDRRELAVAAPAVLDADVGAGTVHPVPVVTLPAPLTTFVGRADEVAELTKSLHHLPPGHGGGPWRRRQDPAGAAGADEVTGQVPDGVHVVDLCLAAGAATGPFDVSFEGRRVRTSDAAGSAVPSQSS